MKNYADETKLEYTHAIAFPADLNDLKILDIGSGQSDCVTRGLDTNYEIFVQAVAEALRVL